MIRRGGGCLERREERRSPSDFRFLSLKVHRPPLAMAVGGHHFRGPGREWLFVLYLLMTFSTFLTDGVTAGNDGGEGASLRLPKALKPTHYNLWLQPFINGNFSVHGKVEVEFEVKIPTNDVTLHMADIITMNESSILIDKGSGRKIIIMKQLYEPSRQFYTARLQEQLKAGRSYALVLRFVGTLRGISLGFYKSSYKKADGTISWVASTQFQPAYARLAFPCFDEPALKATFKIHLARESHMTSLSNMPLVSSTPISDQPGWMHDEYQNTVLMSTYLVAFAISDFTPEVLSDPNDKTLVKAWVRKDVRNQTEFAGKIGMPLLRFFENYFGVDYTLPKLDMICPPMMNSNAMENWGLITYRESGLLFNPRKDSAKKKKWIAYLISHELGHQWIGNLVTLDWWTDLWLNEGLTNFLCYLGLERVEPFWNLMEHFVVEEQQTIFGLDALRSSHPVRVPVFDPLEIAEIFDDISYSKGASIVRMMSHFLTEATFKKGLKNYLATFKFNNVDQDDLWRILTEAAHQDKVLPPYLSVKTIMDSWTQQSGFPVVTVTRIGNRSAVLTQEQFSLDQNLSGGGGKGRDGAVEEPQTWWIPVSFTSQKRPSFGDTRVKIWLNERGFYPVILDRYPEPHHWVIVNVQQSGFYRVNYDIENWMLLAKQLQQDHEAIHVINRAQIIDDAMNLARAGRLPYAVALEVTSYLSKEREYVAWKAAFQNLEFLHNIFRHDHAYGAFQAYMKSILLPLYNHLGFEDQRNDDLQKQLLRGEVLQWACRLKIEDCIHKSLRLFRRWMEDPKGFQGVSSNAADAVYCTAVREGGQSEWQFAWEKNLQAALPCSEHTWIIARYLRATFNESSGIKRQNAAKVFQRVAQEGIGNIVAWEYLKANWKQVADYIRDTFFALPKMIEYVTRTFNTKQELSELIQLQEDNAGNLWTAKRAIEQAIEATRLNVAWMENHYEDIVQWLRGRGFSTDLTSL